MKATILVFLLCTGIAKGQNLVPNSSFEDANICAELKQACSPAGWFYISHMPKGYLLKTGSAASGDKILRIMISDPATSLREYWQTRLLCPLRPGVKYEVQMKVRSEQTVNLSNLGFYFTNELMKNTRDSLLQQANFNFRNAKMKLLKNGWTTLQTTFTAVRNDQYLVIGNFSGDTSYGQRTYIDIDDVMIIAAGKVVCAEAGATKDSLYRITKRHLQVAAAIAAPPKDTSNRIVRRDTIVLRQIEFAFNSHEIKNSRVLDNIYRLLEKNATKVEIWGFTDNTGTQEYNLQLSQKRADEVARLLRHYLGERSVPIEATGKGISIKYASPELNRRVEIIIYRDQ